MEAKLTSEYCSSTIPKSFNSAKDRGTIYLAGETPSNFVRVEFEKIISDISTKFVLSDLKELDSTIETSLKKIFDFFQLDIAALLYQEKENSKIFTLRHIKFRPGSNIQVRPVVTIDSFPWILGELLEGREIIYSRIDELPQQAFIDKQTICEFDSEHSALAVPLLDGDKLKGILALAVAKQIIWPEDLMSSLRVIAHVISAALIRKKTECELQRTLEELNKAKAILESENVCLRQEIKISTSQVDCVYKSQAMSGVLTKAGQVAATNSTVLLCGETGTGKELIASEIHKMSSRSDRIMVRVNCGAIPAALVESEMFGREKGAYTGALSKQIGRFELADKSTIFLDEITELPMEVQVKLLRVLQEREIERLGNPKPIKVDVRIIAATNQNLEKAVRDGKFRDDLYYRLNVFPIEIPPLRERPEDIPMLIWHFVDELCCEFGKKVEGISSKSMAALIKYSWPGNVRELRNVIERAMIKSNSLILHIEIPKATSSVEEPTTNLTLKDIEIQHIRRVLENTSWKIRGKQGAAEILGMKPTTLETRMTKLGIRRPE